MGDPSDNHPGQCIFILFNGERCTNEIWQQGEPYCPQHDIWCLTVRMPEEYAAGEMFQKVAQFLDLKILFYLPSLLVDDDELTRILCSRYGELPNMLQWLEWYRYMVAFAAPCKNELAL